MPIYTNTAPIALPQVINGVIQKSDLPIMRTKPVTYCLYARKSSEDDERQALSIDSQIQEMLDRAKLEKLKVKDVRQESFSAKQSGQRPIFNELLTDIRKGTFNGILTWAPDRLSRNAGDLGILVDLMDSGYLEAIRTHGQTFADTPNDKFLLMILCSQAKLENDNRGENVKRGLRAKAQMGYRPGVTPLGYLNQPEGVKGKKKIFLDQERAPLIREMFEKVAYHGYSGREIYRWLRRDTPLRSRTGKFLTLSTVYCILNQPYYCGMFEYPEKSGNWHPVNHESIITKELFEEVQIRMSTHPKTKPGTKEFDFTRMLLCGACGSGITAQEKFKRFKNGTTRRYVYYNCTKSRSIDCGEPYIREEELVAELLRTVDKLPLNQITAREKLQQEMERFRRFTESVLGDSLIKTRIGHIDLRSFAKYILQEGSREEKRELLSCLKTKLYLKDRHILTDLPKEKPMT
ncbi:MAG: recombinase family protein [bacterium]